MSNFSCCLLGYLHLIGWNYILDRHMSLFFSSVRRTPVMRLVIPQVDKSRAAFGLEETTLDKQYIDILNIAKDSQDAKKLLNYRPPTTAHQVRGDTVKSWSFGKLYPKSLAYILDKVWKQWSIKIVWSSVP